MPKNFLQAGYCLDCRGQPSLWTPRHRDWHHYASAVGRSPDDDVPQPSDGSTLADIVTWEVSLGCPPFIRHT